MSDAPISGKSLPLTYHNLETVIPHCEPCPNERPKRLMCFTFCFEQAAKSDTLTIFFNAGQNSLISEAKEALLSALLAPSNQIHAPHPVDTSADFEICKAEPVKGGGEGAFTYEPLDGESKVKDCKLANWEVLYARFYTPNGGQLLPAYFTTPQIDDDEDAVELDAPERRLKRPRGMDA